MNTIELIRQGFEERQNESNVKPSSEVKKQNETNFERLSRGYKELSES